MLGFKGLLGDNLIGKLFFEGVCFVRFCIRVFNKFLVIDFKRFVGGYCNKEATF